ncbi:MAG: hypothetical protein KC944_07470 [Candidatus Omnitrophica bacterium]|nr:hypothetical protein [Candidatus Omnitrophota bacterium]
MRSSASFLLAPLLIAFCFVIPSEASEDHHHGGGPQYVPPETHVDYVPVKRTRMEEVWQEYYVESTDRALYRMGPKKSADIAQINVIPDNFIKNTSTGAWSEGISLSGEIVQTVEYDADVGADPNDMFDPIAIQTQVISSDKERKSPVTLEPLDASLARYDRRADPANPKRIVVTRTFQLGYMAPIFIPYSSLRSVLFVGPRGTLMRIVTVQVAVVGPGGNVLVGPGGPVIFTQTVTLNSFTLPTWLPPANPWPVFNPVVFIPTLQIPMPWLFGGRRGGPSYVTFGPVTGGPARPGVPIGGPPPGGVASGPKPGTPIGGPGGGPQPGTPIGGPGSGNGPQPGTPIGGPGGGAGTPGQGPNGGPQPGTPVGGPGSGQPPTFSPGGAVVLGATEDIPLATLEVTVPSKKYLTYWFTLPEKGGNFHEVTLKMTNYSVGVGLANLAAIPLSEAKAFQQARKRIQDLPNIGVNLETETEEQLKTVDIAEQVASYQPQDRMYILILAAPTVDENVIEVEGLPAWALPMVFEKEQGPDKFDPDIDLAMAVN